MEDKTVGNDLADKEFCMKLCLHFGFGVDLGNQLGRLAKKHKLTEKDVVGLINVKLFDPYEHPFRYYLQFLKR